jgi:glycerophosphoryl diester phosphodiesterase
MGKERGIGGTEIWVVANLPVKYFALICMLNTLPLLLLGQPIITGHRGAAGLAPENTLVSVQKALDLGVHRVEVDVQQTKDGVVICMHDRTLDRTTSMKGEVRENFWIDLQKAKANIGFETEYPNASIPTLEELLQLIQGKAEFVIEIKDGNAYYPGIEDKVAALIQKHKAEKWAVVHTFNDDALFYLHEKHPTIRLQKLFVSHTPSISMMLDFKLHTADLSDYFFVEAFSVHHSFITKAIVKDAHAMGKKVHVWTVNEPKEMKKMLKLGVDGIITDRPDVLLKQ